MAQKAYFVIADITGYTAFLTGSELDHAQDILKSLFNVLLENIKSPLVISNFQGDAILSYAPDGSFLQGQTLLETVENIYSAFAWALESMHRNTTCTCKACSNIPNLDLKLFVHHGEYVMQDLLGKQELSGPDVIVVHRMMKNEVKEKTGLKAYALFTEAAVRALGIEEFCQEMQPHSERYEHLGEVNMYAHSLHSMWAREREKRRVVVEPEHVWMTIEADLPAPPALVWDYLNEPQHRRRWMAVKSVLVSGKSKGRVGAGSMHHCIHGDKDADKTDFLIVDWRPFDYLTQDAVLPMQIRGRCTTRLTPTESGTHLTFTFAEQTSPNPLVRLMLRLVMGRMIRKMLLETYGHGAEIIRQMIAEDLAAGKVTIQPLTQAA